jgi:predicted ribosomally synthesized six-cysteine peptide SCIFF
MLSNSIHIGKEGISMAKHIVTVNKGSLQSTVKTGGCGECQASCQSACKTSCTVGNQVCQK